MQSYAEKSRRRWRGSRRNDLLAEPREPVEPLERAAKSDSISDSFKREANRSKLNVSERVIWLIAGKKPNEHARSPGGDSQKGGKNGHGRSGYSSPAASFHFPGQALLPPALPMLSPTFQ